MNALVALVKTEESVSSNPARGRCSTKSSARRSRYLGEELACLPAVVGAMPYILLGVRLIGVN